MSEETVLSLFVSSPGDVQRERERIDSVVERLNAEYAGRARIRTIRWETQYYSSHDTFQAQIPEAAECDLVVAIFAARLGSPLPETFPPMPSGEPYPSGSAYEVLSSIEARRKGHGTPDIYVFRRPSAPLIAIDAPNRDEIEAQWKRVVAFFETWFRARGGQFIAAFQEFANTDEFAEKIEDCLRQWLQRRGFPPRLQTWDRLKLGSPYPGLAAFDANRQTVFFGRSLFIEQALRRLREIEGDERFPFLLLIGASGSGKSSLLRAGLMPRVGLAGALPEVDLWRRAVAIPGADPFLSLAEALLGADALGPELAQGPFAARDLLVKQLASDPAVAVAPIEAALKLAAEIRRRGNGFEAARPARLFLALDQAERLLIECPAEAQSRFAAFVAELCRRKLATVLIALRSDAYARFQTLEPFVLLRERGATLDLLPATPSELEEMATRPAMMSEPPLAFERRDGRSLAATLTADAQGGDALPLLQMTLARLCAAEAVRGDGVLRFADYRGLGEAVSAAAAEAMAKLTPEARAQLPNLIAGLVRDFAVDATSGKSAPIIGALERARFEVDRPERKALIDAFIAHRLLTSEGDAASGRVRPTHESLLRIWPEAVAILAETELAIRARAAIEPLARGWAEAGEADKARHLEISPALLEAAQGYVARFDDEVSPVTRAFVDAAAQVAAARRERERQEQERRIADAEKIARANRRIAIASGLGLAAALTLAGLAGWQWRVAVSAEQEAQKQRARAEDTLNVATETANDLVFDLAQKFHSIKGMPTPLIKDILDRARRLQDQLIGKGESSAHLSKGRADALGQEALAEITLGETAQALKLATEARDIYAELFKRAPTDLPTVNNLAFTEGVLGEVYTALGKSDAADAAYDRQRRILEDALKRGVDDVRLRRIETEMLFDLSARALARGDGKAALDLAREALQAAKDYAKRLGDDKSARHDLAIAYRNLGDAEFNLGDLTAADGDFQTASGYARALAKEYPDNTVFVRDATLSDERLGGLLLKKRDFVGALKAYADGTEIAAALSRGDPANLEWRHDVAIGEREIGDAKAGLGDLAGAREAYQQAADIDRALLAKTPENVDWRDYFADTLERLANTAANTNDEAAALTTRREAEAVALAALAGHPGDAHWSRRAMQAEDEIGVALIESGRDDEALAVLTQARERARFLADDALGRETEIDNLMHLSELSVRKGDIAGALALQAQAEQFARALIAKDGASPAPRGKLAVALVRMARLRSSEQQTAAAIDEGREAIALLSALVHDDPTEGLWSAELRRAYDILGDGLNASGDAAGAIDAYRHSLAVYEALPQADKRAAALSAAMTHEALAPLAMAEKDSAGALAEWRAAETLRREYDAANLGLDDNLTLWIADEKKIGAISNALGKPAEALSAFRTELEIARRRAGAPNADASARTDLVLALFLVGTQLQIQLDAKAAEEPLAEALRLAEAAAAAAPTDLPAARLNGAVARALGVSLAVIGDANGALAAFMAARKADQAVLSLAPGGEADRIQLAKDVTQIGLLGNARLLARDFSGALATLAEARPLAPDQNWIDMARAFTLMFLDRGNEAKAIFLAHRGETGLGGKSWERSVIDSVAFLRGKGLSHPQLAEIEALFAGAK